MQSVSVPREFRGRHILVADDNASNRIIIRQWLTMAGIHVQLVVTGREACSAVSDSDPDLVFMDVRMPGMDGIEAAQQLRRSGFSKPIVGLSAASSKMDQNACLSAGMSDFLAKPIDVDELWGCLTRWLKPCGNVASATMPCTGSSGSAVEARFLGNAVTLQRAHEAFVACHHDDAQKLRNMLAEGDHRSMTNLVHALKGSAATLGLNALTELALALERKIQTNSRPQELQQLIDWIDDQLVLLAERP
jgi:two-component system sensor histidine kinase/response regulator